MGRIQSALENTYNKTSLLNQHGVAVSVYVPGYPQWNSAVGTADDVNPMTGNYALEVGSVTKTFTSALILQLQEEGKLSINDSISNYLPTFPNIDSTITIKQLLNHSSGIFDYVNDDTTHALLNSAYFEEPEKVWSVEEILQNYVQAPRFKPGKSYRYSNTNYLLLGMIAEKVTGRSYTQEVRERFFTPFGLTHTFFGWADSITLPFPHYYTASNGSEPGFDFYSIPRTAQLTQGRFDGGIVSTTEDLAKWSKALYTGKVLNNASMSQMLVFHTLQDGGPYGLGVEKVPYYSRTLYGHSGGMPGFVTMMYTNPKDSATLVVVQNSDPGSGDISPNDYAIAILNEIYRAPSAVTTHPVNNLKAAFYPNPAIQSTTLEYQIAQASIVELTVTNLLGQTVYSKVIRDAVPGKHILTLDRNSLPSGTYNYQLHTYTGIVQGHLLFQ